MPRVDASLNVADTGPFCPRPCAGDPLTLASSRNDFTTSPALKDSKAGARLKLVVTLGVLEDQALDVVTRWAAGETIGVEIVDAAPTATQAIGKYVAELLERGSSA